MAWRLVDVALAPERATPVRIVVGFAPSGGNDIIARLIAQWPSERVGHQFLIENRPGPFFGRRQSIPHSQFLKPLASH